MVKRKNCVSVFSLKRGQAAFKVILETLKNTPSGCPRYRAIILDEHDYSWVYVFKGHYLSEQGEAEWILDHMLGEEDE